MTTKDKKKKTTLINICLPEDDKRAIKLNKIFEEWESNGLSSKVNKVTTDLAFLNEMEKTPSIRYFLSFYSTSLKLLSSLFEEDDAMLYVAMEELFADSVRQMHLAIAERSYEVHAKYLKQREFPQAPVSKTPIVSIEEQPSTPVPLQEVEEAQQVVPAELPNVEKEELVEEETTDVPSFMVMDFGTVDQGAI